MDTKIKKGIGTRKYMNIFWMITFLMIFFEILLLKEGYRASQLKEQNLARIEADQVVSKIQTELQIGLNIVEVIDDLYAVYGEKCLEDFDSICEELLNDNDAFGSIYFAPGGVVEYAYPQLMKKLTIGFNMLEDEVQGPMSLLALESKQITVAGPHNLVEGGKGFIIRKPIFDAGRFIAFVIVDVNIDELFTHVSEDLAKTREKYNFFITKSYDSTALVDKYGRIYSTSNEIISDDITVSFAVSNDEWNLSIEPINGWNPWGEMVIELVLSLIILTLAIAGVYSYIRSYERKKIAARLLRQEREAEHQALIETYNKLTREKQAMNNVQATIGSGAWTIDFNENAEIISCEWSDTFREMLGYEAEEEFPNDIQVLRDSIYEEDREETVNSLWETIKDYSGKKTYEADCRMILKDGSLRWFHTAGRLSRRDDGSPITFTGLFIDIDEKKNTDQALMNALESAENANNAKTDFLSSMSHDIRTPMNGIIGMTSIAAANIDNPAKVKDCLEKISGASKHLLSLVNDILDLSKIESGNIVLDESTFSIGELLDDIVNILMTQIKAKDINFTCKVETMAHETVIGDKLKIQQLYTNIISNAIKYTPEGGSVYVTFSEKHYSNDAYAIYELICEDTGFGMTEDFINNKLFSPFERSEDNRVKTIQGTGLGMTIARNIALMMDGDIKVESQVNKGSRFTISIRIKTVESGNIYDDRFENIRILVRDEDPSICENTCRRMREFGVNAIGISPTEDAIVKVENSKCDVLLYGWPDDEKEGIAFIKKVRALKGSDLKIVVSTRYDLGSFERDVLLAGADGFISKPLFKKKLFDRLREIVLNEQMSAKVETMVFSDTSKYADKVIMLVEDNELNIDIATEILKATGAKIEVAQNGQIALQMFEESSINYYSMIYMDIQMPVMNGLDATRAIRTLQREDSRTVPIVAMSANAFSEDINKALVAGMNDYVPKPIELKRVVTTLEKYL